MSQYQLLGAGSVAGGGFLPTDLANLKWWHPNSDLAGYGDTDPITTWNDASGNGNDQTNTGSVQVRTGVQNGLPAIEVDATAGERMNIASMSYTGTDFTLFVAGKLDVTSINSFWLDLPGANRAIYEADTATGFYEYTQFNPVATVTMGASSTAFEIQVWVVDAGTVEVFRNGSSAGSGLIAPGMTPSTGAAKLFEASFQGKCGEIGFLEQAVSTADRGSLETYLNGNFAVY